MARITECLSCQDGNHRGHTKVVQAVGEGVMGGAICDCRGECVERGPLPNSIADLMVKLYERAQCPECASPARCPTHDPIRPEDA